jgi:hypothetical protein
MTCCILSLSDIARQGACHSLCYGEGIVAQKAAARFQHAAAKKKKFSE